MGAAEALESFFRAENDRGWEGYRTFLHADVAWHLHAGRETVIQGAEGCLRAMQGAYRGSGARFRVEEVHESARGERAAALLVDDGGRRPLEVFDFEDGRIRRGHEFLLG